MGTFQDWQQQIVERQATIGIVGLGYVGLPLALSFVEAGFNVIGFDVDPRKKASVEQGSSYISHIPDERIAAANRTGLSVETGFETVNRCSTIILCLPTPLNSDNEPDLSYVVSSLETMLPFLVADQLLILESTTYPGTTEEELRPRIEDVGFSIGEDFYLAYSPEREDPGNKTFTTSNIPKIVAGSTPSCLERAISVYETVIEKLVPVSSTQVAEMAKLLENIHRAVNVGLVNELKMVCDALGVDIHEVIDAAATKPFGFVPYYPGPGMGGHCLPIDPFYLSWKAKQVGVESRFIEITGQVNSEMPKWVVGKIRGALADRGLDVEGAQILLLGLSYKKNVNDTRESPAVAIMAQLEAEGAIVSYSDPFVPSFPQLRRYDSDAVSTELTAASVSAADAVVLVTDHDAFDRELIAENARLLIDTRGVFRDNASVVKA